MPKLGHPAAYSRHRAEATPAIDAVLAILGRDTVLQRLEQLLD